MNIIATLGKLQGTYSIVNHHRTFSEVNSRKTIHAIISRLSVDALIGRMMCVRDDERFRAVGPEDMILPYRFPALHATYSTGQDSHDDLEVEIWFDWAFVDFWKSNYCMLFSAVLPWYSLKVSTRHNTTGNRP